MQVRDATQRTLAARRAHSTTLDLALRLVERDRATDGSVIASAVALRVFLLFVPLLLVVIASVGFLSSQISAADVSRQVGVTGGLAAQIDNALHQTSRARWVAMSSGIIGAL